MIGPSGSDIDIEIDLRGVLPPVRDQRQRNSCLACATSDAHAHSHVRDHPLSAEFLFFHAAQLMPGANGNNGLTFAAAEQALRDSGQPDEGDWPYQDTQPDPWAPPTVGRCWHGSMTSALGVPGIVASLKSQKPVVLGISMTTGFLNPAKPYVVSAVGMGIGRHAVLAVGLGKNTAKGSILLIRNSWGIGWGNLGHAWLEIGYLADKLIGYQSVSAL